MPRRTAARLSSAQIADWNSSFCPYRRIVREMRLQQREQLVAIELAHVEFVAEAGDFAVRVLVGRGDDQHAVVAEHAREAGDHAFLRLDMLERFEARR